MEERVQKIIAAAGIASRRAAEQLILDGRVKVNGAVVTELGTKADPARDHIKVDGKLINPRQPMTYLMLNKPSGYVTTMSDPEGRPVVTDLLKGVKTRVYPVGRLDYDTEGLLLLTNDGDFAHLVTHPSHELPKTYVVKVKGVLEDRDVLNLERGVFLKDGKTAPARVRRLRKEEANSWVEITIHEGRKRQVRRMIDHTGKSVIKLKRTRVGSLELGDLPLGAFRHLGADEVKSFRDAAQGGEQVEATERVTSGGSVAVPSGPGGAKRQLTFIEGPKKKERPRIAALSRRSTKSYPAKGRADNRAPRPAPGDRIGGEIGARPAQRGPRPAGGRSWMERRSSEGAAFGQRAERSGAKKPWQKNSSKPSFGGPERPSRGGRTNKGFEPRGGERRPFSGKPAWQEEQGARTRSSRRPWPARRSEGTEFGQRPERSGNRKPWEKRSSMTSFRGPEGSSRRAGWTGSGFKARGGQDRALSGRPSAQERRGPRPEGQRSWSAEKRNPESGFKGSRPRAGGARSSGPKTGWSRPGNDRGRKGGGRGRG